MDSQAVMDKVADGLRDAVMGAAISDAEESSQRFQNVVKTEKPRGRVGDGTPGPGRPKGSVPRVTRSIREAVEAAAKPGGCHPDGLAGWLIERAQGGLGDRQIFAAMVSKAMPLQVQANVDGGIKIQLGWLGQRQIGTTTAQIPAAPTQSIDLQQEDDGTYRIIDQPTRSAGGAGDASAGGDGQPAAAGGVAGRAEQNGPEGAQGA